MKKLKTLLLATLTAANIYTLVSSDKHQQDQPTLLSIEHFEYDFYQSYINDSIEVDHDAFIAIKVAYTIKDNNHYSYLLSELNEKEYAIASMILSIEEGQ